MKRPPDWALNWLLALLSAALLMVIFPRLNLTWLAPFALTPLLLGLAGEPRPLHRFLMGWTAGAVYWFATCTWIQFVLEVHGGMGRWGGWGSFLLFCVLKAIHLGIFAMLAAIVGGASDDERRKLVQQLVAQRKSFAPTVGAPSAASAASAAS